MLLSSGPDRDRGALHRHNAYACKCQTAAATDHAGDAPPTEGAHAASSSSASRAPSAARVCSERLLAVDCEMVRRVPPGLPVESGVRLLARVSLVNCAGQAIVDQFVHQSPENLDYGTEISGVEADDLVLGGRRAAITFEQAQALLRPLLLEQGNTIVGHGLDNDFEVIGFAPPSEFVRDSTVCPFLCPDPKRPRSLANLVKDKLGIDLRAPDASHDSVDDAWAAMQLFLSVRDRWEEFREQRAAEEQEAAAAAAAGVAPEPSPEPASRSFAPQQSLKSIMLHYHISDIFAPLPEGLMRSAIPAAFDSAEQYAHILRPLIVEESRTSCARTLQLLSQTEEPGGLANAPIQAGVTAITLDSGFISARFRILHSPHQDAAAADQLLPFTLCMLLESSQAVDIGARLKKGVALKGAGFDDFPAHLFVLIGGEWEPKARRRGNKPRKGEVEDRFKYYTFSADEAKMTAFMSAFEPDHPVTPTTFSVVPLDSTITAIRADEALQRVKEGLNIPACFASILSGRVVGASADADADAAAMDDGPLPFAFRSELDQFCRSQMLNESQQQAIMAAAESLSARQSITLVQGPPGTGKTSTCTALLSMLTGAPCDNRGPLRVLCCAPTNVAVREIAKRFAKCFLFAHQASSHTDAAADGSASSSSASMARKPARLAPQFSSFVEGQSDLSLDLSQLLLVGVKKDIDPFAIERIWQEEQRGGEEDEDDEAQREIHEDQADEGRGGDNDELDAEESEDDDEDAVAPQPGQGQPVLHGHHHALSSIFLDHRERRLQLLFERLRSQLIAMRNTKLFDSSFLPLVLQFADKQEGDRSTLSKQRIASHLKARVAQWKEMADTCCAQLQASFDLPRMGPVAVLAQCTSPITSTSGREQLRAAAAALLDALTRMLDAVQANEQQLRDESGPRVSLRAVQSEAQLLSSVSIANVISSARRGAHSSAGQLEQLIDWWQLCLSSRRWIQSVLLLNARIVFSTVSCSARACIRKSEETIDAIQREKRRARLARGMQPIDPTVFNIRAIGAVVMDEAAQLCEAQLAITFTHRIQRYFLIGDTEQLPAVVMSQELKQLHFARSMYERLQRLHAWPVFMLQRQYRMHPAIASFSNAEFYEGKIIDDESCSARPHAPWTSHSTEHFAVGQPRIRPHMLFDRAMSFINVPAQGANGTGESQDALQSWYNELEEKILLKLLHELVHRVAIAVAGGFQLSHPISVGVVSPYRRQTLNLARAIDREFPPNSAHGGCLSIQAATVDAFQGQERQVLFFTAVRSNPNGNIGFTNSRPRLNVALTRAQQLLVVLGDAATLTKRDPLWQHFAQHCASRGWTIQAGQLPELEKLLSQRNRILAALDALCTNSAGKGTLHLEHNGFDLQLSGEVESVIRSLPATARRRWMEVFLQLKLGSFPVGPLAQWHRRIRNKGLVGLPRAAAARLLGIVHPWTIHGSVLVWSLELRRGPVVYDQILRLWGLIPKGSQNRVDDLLRSLAKHFLAKSDAALDRIRIDLAANPKQTHWKPQSWSIKDHPAFQIKSTPSALEAAAVGAVEADSSSSSVSDLSSSLQQMKFFALSTRYTSRLLSPSANADFEAPLVLGDAEEAIASQTSSLLILGRSGTGKTTIQLLRLFRLEMANRDLRRQQQEEMDKESQEAQAAAAAAMEPCSATTSQDVPPRPAKATLDGAYRGTAPIHQLMLTQSPQLRAQMRAQWKRMLRAEEDPTADVAAAPESKEDLERKDAEASASGSADHGPAVDDVPSDFRRLEHKDFPLFLTSNQLLLMIDGTNDRRYFKHEDAAAIASLPTFGEAPSILNGRHELDQMIDFHSFTILFWPHLNTKIASQFSPATVWTELMAAINRIPKFEQRAAAADSPAPASAGGKAAAASSSSAAAPATQFLSRAEYVSHAVRGSSLKESQRNDVYTLFESYREMKKARDSFDLCDAVWFISEQLCVRPWRGVYIHKIYVDEVQDLLPSQLAMLSVLGVREPENDFVFAGDTAQAISAGISFRFAQLKDQFYTALIPAERRDDPRVRVPELSHLLTNYRSHAAVLHLANSVVQLLTHFFPLSIDRLASEVSGTQGAIPMLIMSKSDNQTLFGGAWGAEQVILVRDARTKAQLTLHNPEALILTIAESKGLEFRDVLLYHFFTDAPASTKSALRLVYAFLRARGVALGSKQTPPDFDGLKHDQLNSELKNLYVAITRARWNVWIVEKNDDSVAPMRALWSQGLLSDQAAAGAAMARPSSSSSSSLVHVMDNQSEIDSLILTVQSTPAEFARKAHELFDRAKYDHAAMLFRKGLQPEWEQKALAFAAKQRGEQAALEVRAMRNDKCNSMDLARIVCDRKSSAAKNAYAELSQAGHGFLALTPPMHREAALSFKACGEFSLAIDSFRAIRAFSQAIDLCLAVRPAQIERALDIAEFGHRWEDALAIALTHRAFMTLEQAARCVRWLTQCTNAAMRTAWVTRALSDLSARIDAAQSSEEQELYSTLFGRLLNTQSIAEKSAQVDRLERDGNLSVAAQVQVQIDPSQAASKFALHGHLFKAASIRLRANATSADSPVANREAIRLLLEILRVGQALPLWLAQPMPWTADYRQIMELCIAQAEEGCPTPLQTTELQTMRALRRLTSAMHSGDAVSLQLSPSGLTPAQVVTSMLTHELDAVRVAEDAADTMEARAITFRCRLSLLNALVRHCMQTMPHPQSPFIALDPTVVLQCHLCEWLSAVDLVSISVGAVSRGRAVNAHFRALEQMFGIPDSDDAHFRRVFVRAMDHPEIEAAQDAVSRLQAGRKGPLPFFLVSLLHDCLPAGSKIATVTADANAFKRFASVQIDHLCHLMRWTLLHNQSSVLAECVDAWESRLSVTLPCTHLSLASGKPCAVCRQPRHAHERGLDPAMVPVVLGAIDFLSQMQQRLSEVQSELHDANRGVSPVAMLQRAASQWMQRAVSIVLLHADSTLWPPLATLVFRNPNSPFSSLFERRCLALVEQGNARRSAAAAVPAQPLPFRLSALLELLILSRLMFADYVIPDASSRLPLASAPRSVLDRKVRLQVEYTRRARLCAEFLAKYNKSWRHKPQLVKQEKQLREDRDGTANEIASLEQMARTSLLLSSLAGALFQSLELQSRLQRASQLDWSLIFAQSGDAMVQASPIPADNSSSSSIPAAGPPLLFDGLLASVYQGSESLIQYYQQFILLQAPVEVDSHWHCLPRRTFDEQAHAACMPILQFLHLAQHFTVLLCCLFHRMRYVALPTSVALESMGDAASERLLCFVSESAVRATDAEISEVGRLIHNFRDVLTDLAMHLPERCRAFCSEDHRGRAAATATASSASSGPASGPWRSDATVLAQIRRKLVMLLLTIGLNHSRDSWTYCFRALQSDVAVSQSDASGLQQYDSAQLYASLPQLAGLAQLPSPQSLGHLPAYPPFCLGWTSLSHFRFPHHSHSIRKFESTARKTVVHVLGSVDPLVMLAADPAFIPAYLVGVITAHPIVPRAFSLQAITGIAHTPLQQPLESANASAPASASSAAAPMAVGGAPSLDADASAESNSEDAALSAKFDGIHDDKAAAKLVREARRTQALLRDQEIIREAARYGSMFACRARILRWVASARARSTQEVSPEEQLRRRSQAWIQDHAADWSPQYRQLFHVRVPNLAIKVITHLREAQQFMAEQQQRKRMHEERTRRDNAMQHSTEAASSGPAAGGASMLAADHDDDVASVDRFKSLLRLSPSASSDPFRLDHCAKLIAGLEEARRLLNVSDPSHAAAVQSVDKLTATLAQIADTIRHAVADMKSLATAEVESNDDDAIRGSSTGEEPQQSVENKEAEQSSEEEEEEKQTSAASTVATQPARSASKATLPTPPSASASSSAVSSGSAPDAAATRASNSLLASLAKSAAAAAASAPAPTPTPAPVVSAAKLPQRCSKCDCEFVLSALDPPEITRCKPCREQARLDRKKKKPATQALEATLTPVEATPATVTAKASTTADALQAPTSASASSSAALPASNKQTNASPVTTGSGSSASRAQPGSSDLDMSQLNKLLRSKPTDGCSVRYVDRAHLLCRSTPPDWKAALSDADSFMTNFARAKRVGGGLAFDLFPHVPMAMYLQALCHSRLRNNLQGKPILDSLRKLLDDMDDDQFTTQCQWVSQHAQQLDARIHAVYTQRLALAQSDPSIFDRCALRGQEEATVQRWFLDGMLPCRLCSVQFVCDVDDLKRSNDCVCAECRPEANRQAKAAEQAKAAQATKEQAEAQKRMEQAKALEKQRRMAEADARRAAAQRAQDEQAKQQQAAGKAAEVARAQALAAQQAQQAAQTTTADQAPASAPQRSQPASRQSCKPEAVTRRPAPDDDEEEQDEDDDSAFALRLGRAQTQHALQQQGRSTVSAVKPQTKQGGAGIGNSVNPAKPHTATAAPLPRAQPSIPTKSAAAAVIASCPAATPSSGLDPLAQLRLQQQRELEQLQRSQELELQQVQAAISKRRTQEAGKAAIASTAPASQAPRPTDPPPQPTAKAAVSSASAHRPSSATPAVTPCSGLIRGRMCGWKSSVLGLITVSAAHGVNGQRDFLFHIDQIAAPASELREGIFVEFKIFVRPKDGKMFANAVRPAALPATGREPSRISAVVRAGAAAGAGVAVSSSARAAAPPSSRSWNPVPVPVAVNLRAQSREEIDTDLAMRLSLQPHKKG